MASKGDTHKGDTQSDDGHSGGDEHASGKSSAQPAKKSGGGNAAANLLRNPVTWALAGVAALAAVVFSGVVPMPTVQTQPSSYSTPDSTTVAESDGEWLGLVVDAVLRVVPASEDAAVLDLRTLGGGGA